MFLTNYNKYQTRTLNLVLKAGLLARESKECRRGYIRSKKTSTNSRATLLQILASLMRLIDNLPKIMQLSQYSTKKIKDVKQY